MNDISQYSRTFNQYKYSVPEWPMDGNIGDCIQSIAVENLLKKAGIGNVGIVNRDEVSGYDGCRTKLVMQGWFADYAGVRHFPLSANITPVFIGFHLNVIKRTRERFIINGYAESLKPYQPVGCRDRDTAGFLRRIGVDAYFSGCMTLTFDKRKSPPSDGGKVFIVDLDKKSLSKVPEDILKRADSSVSHKYFFKKHPISREEADDFENRARLILERYKNEASLVITSKIHVAMPCIAMGIPVVFISDDVYNERFDVLKGIIPLYSYKDAKYVDWNPQAADIGELKNAIIENAIAQIRGTASNGKTVEKLNAITSKLEYIPTTTRVRWLFRSLIRKIYYKKLKRNIRICVLNAFCGIWRKIR